MKTVAHFYSDKEMDENATEVYEYRKDFVRPSGKPKVSVRLNEYRISRVTQKSVLLVDGKRERKGMEIYSYGPCRVYLFPGKESKGDRDAVVLLSLSEKEAFAGKTDRYDVFTLESLRGKTERHRVQNHSTILSKNAAASSREKWIPVPYFPVSGERGGLRVVVPVYDRIKKEILLFSGESLLNKESFDRAGISIYNERNGWGLLWVGSEVSLYGKGVSEKFRGVINLFVSEGKVWIASKDPGNERGATLSALDERNGDALGLFRIGNGADRFLKEGTSVCDGENGIVVTGRKWAFHIDKESGKYLSLGEATGNPKLGDPRFFAVGFYGKRVGMYETENRYEGGGNRGLVWAESFVYAENGRVETTELESVFLPIGGRTETPVRHIVEKGALKDAETGEVLVEKVDVDSFERVYEDLFLFVSKDRKSLYLMKGSSGIAFRSDVEFEGDYRLGLEFKRNSPGYDREKYTETYAHLLDAPFVVREDLSSEGWKRVLYRTKGGGEESLAVYISPEEEDLAMAFKFPKEFEGMDSFKKTFVPVDAGEKFRFLDFGFEKDSRRIYAFSFEYDKVSGETKLLDKLLLPLAEYELDNAFNGNGAVFFSRYENRGKSGIVAFLDAEGNVRAQGVDLDVGDGGYAYPFRNENDTAGVLFVDESGKRREIVALSEKGAIRVPPDHSVWTRRFFERPLTEEGLRFMASCPEVSKLMMSVRDFLHERNAEISKLFTKIAAHSICD